MPKLSELTKEQLRGGLTGEQKTWLVNDAIKNTELDIDDILKDVGIPDAMKQELVKEKEVEIEDLTKQRDDLQKKLIEADKGKTARKLPEGGKDEKYPMKSGEYMATMALMQCRKDGMPVKGLTTERLNKYREMSGEIMKAAGAGMEAEDWSEGGALISPEFSSELFRIGYESAGLANMARNMTVNGNSLEIKIIKGADQSSGYVSGGVMVYWIDKEEAPTASKPVTDRIKFELKKAGGLSYADMELLEDSPISVEQMLQNDFGDAFAMMMDDGMINGTGAGDMLGVLSAPCLVTVAIETGQTLAGDPIMFENINKMYAHLPNAGKRRAIWSINPDMTPVLPQMKMTIGTGGVPVFLPLGGASTTPFATIFNRPVIENDCQSALGTVGDIVLGDWSQYGLVRKSAGVRYETSIHFKFDTDEMAFKWVWRLDGKALWYTYKTPRRGSTTRTPFVTLAARS